MCYDSVLDLVTHDIMRLQTDLSQSNETAARILCVSGLLTSVRTSKRRIIFQMSRDVRRCFDLPFDSEDSFVCFITPTPLVPTRPGQRHPHATDDTGQGTPLDAPTMHMQVATTSPTCKCYPPPCCSRVHMLVHAYEVPGTMTWTRIHVSSPTFSYT